MSRPLETRRLNITVTCPGCKTQVNPFVVREFNSNIELECPTCTQRFGWNGNNG